MKFSYCKCANVPWPLPAEVGPAIQFLLCHEFHMVPWMAIHSFACSAVSAWHKARSHAIALLCCSWHHLTSDGSALSLVIDVQRQRQTVLFIHIACV